MGSLASVCCFRDLTRHPRGPQQHPQGTACSTAVPRRQREAKSGMISRQNPVCFLHWILQQYSYMPGSATTMLEPSLPQGIPGAGTTRGQAAPRSWQHPHPTSQQQRSCAREQSSSCSPQYLRTPQAAALGQSSPRSHRLARQISTRWYFSADERLTLFLFSSLGFLLSLTQLGALPTPWGLVEPPPPQWELRGA